MVHVCAGGAHSDSASLLLRRETLIRTCSAGPPFGYPMRVPESCLVRLLRKVWSSNAPASRSLDSPSRSERRAPPPPPSPRHSAKLAPPLQAMRDSTPLSSQRGPCGEQLRLIDRAQRSNVFLSLSFFFFHWALTDMAEQPLISDRRWIMDAVVEGDVALSCFRSLCVQPRRSAPARARALCAADAPARLIPCATLPPRCRHPEP
jgi:hypothetical protein